ncbi:uncharacterized protein LOC143282301 [Babylonia areolata]|uniref:uncharacterized protein LOC143282301 n=1 Tax=Babylonia areolata TaxID=304850 RepID=UPI003FD0EDBF
MDDHKGAGHGLDTVLISLGWPGWFQISQLCLLFLCLAPAALNMMAIVFIGKMNKHQCKETTNDTSHMIPPDVTNVTYGTCSVTWVNVTGEKTETPCPNGLEFAEPPDHSVTSEWGLVCEEEALTDVSQMLMMVGMMVGAVVITSLADRYGRKPLHIVSGLGVLIFGLATAFAPNFTVFLALRFFLGAFEQGIDLTGVIMGMEMMPTRLRFVHLLCGSVVWGCCMVLLGLLAFLMRHFPWRYLQLLICGFSVYTFLLIHFLEESVRWLVANGRVEHAERILKKAAAQNKVSQVNVLNVFRTNILGQHTSDEGHDLKNGASEVPGGHPEPLIASPSAPGDKEDLPKYGITDFVRHKHVFVCTVINGFAWGVNVMTYYGLLMTSVNLADDMYLGFALNALVEVPSGPVALFFSQRFGRKRFCAVFHVLAGLSLLASVALSSLAGDNKAATTAAVALSLLGKFSITATFATLFLYTPEQFPTNLRNASLGVASMAGRVGGMIAPYSRTLSRHFPWVPGTIFGVLCLLQPVCMWKLPETCGRELPQTIEDMELYFTAPDTVSRRSENGKQKWMAHAAKLVLNVSLCLPSAHIGEGERAILTTGQPRISINFAQAHALERSLQCRCPQRQEQHGRQQLRETRLPSGASLRKPNYTFFWQGKELEEPRLRNFLLSSLEPPYSGTARILTLRMSTSSGPTKDQFYEELDTTIRAIPVTEQLYLLGDFNARVGSDHDSWPSFIGDFSTGKLNENGQRLQDADCDTDHSLVGCKVRLQPKRIHHSKKKSRPRINTARTAIPDLCDCFANSIEDALKDCPAGCAEKRWNHIRDAIYNTATETFDCGNIHDMYDGMKKAFGSCVNKIVPLKSAFGTIVTDRSKQVERRAENYQELYSRENIVADAAMDSTAKFSVMEELDIPPSGEELSKAIDSLARGKAPGKDGIPPEVIKAGKRTVLLHHLHQLLLQCWEEGTKIGCPPKLRRMITSFHEDMKGTVQHDGSSSDPLPIKSGVKQGCVLALTLFGVFFSLLLSYAFSQSEDGVEFGLTISLKKTNVMGQDVSSTPSISTGDFTLEVVEDFTCLSSINSSGLSLDAELNKWIGKAATVMSRLAKRIWDNPMLTINTKMQMYQACVLSTLRCSSETWTLYSRQERRLNTFHLRNLRRILGITWQDRKSEEKKEQHCEEGRKRRRQRAESVPFEPGATFTCDNCNKACQSRIGLELFIIIIIIIIVIISIIIIIIITISASKMDSDKGISQGLDAVLITLGWPGRFQIIQLFQLFLYLFPASMNILAIVFIGKINEYRCKEVTNDTSHMIPPDVTNVTYGTCSVTWVNVTGEKTETPCPKGLEFAEPPDHSVMSEWGLVCEKEALTDVSQTLMMVGMMVGAVVITSLADRYGRKPLHIVSGLGVLLFGLATAFAPSFAVFMSLRFFLGASQQGSLLTGVIMGMEMLPARRRYIHFVVSSIFWGCAVVLLGLLAFLLRHFPWRYLQATISGFAVYTFLLIYFLEESVRWLVANGRVEHAERILKKAAAQNKVSQVNVLNVFRTNILRQHTSDEGHDLKSGASEVPGGHPEPLIASPSASGDKEDLPTYGITDLFRHKHVFMSILINGFAWLVNTMTFYGLSMTSVTLTDDMYLGFGLSGLIEIPSNVIAFFLAERFGRKRILAMFHVLAGLSLLTSVALSSFAGDTQASSIAAVALSLLGKFAITATFRLLFLYIPEQFPTTLRNTGLGVTTTAGRVGGMIAPYSRTLSRHFPWVPGTIFGVLCLLQPVCMWKLPETCGRELPQTIEDMELYFTAPDTVSRRSENRQTEVRYCLKCQSDNDTVLPLSCVSFGLFMFKNCVLMFSANHR